MSGSDGSPYGSSPPGSPYQNVNGISLASAGVIMFGTDTNLYRSFANTLKTDDELQAATFRLGNGTAVIAPSGTGALIQFTRQGAAAPAAPGNANVLRLYTRDGTVGGTLALALRAGTAGAEQVLLDNIPQT